MNTTIQAVQHMLGAICFYAGPADGMPSPELNQAVQRLRDQGAPDEVENFQRLVGAKPDGDFGPCTQSAWRAVKVQALAVGAILAPEDRVLSSPDAKWTVEEDGADLVVRNGIATAFGGDDDAGDDGETACGYPTTGHPDLEACSLPENIHCVPSLRGSPIPRLPYGLHADGTRNPDGAFVIVTFLDGDFPPQFDASAVLGPWPVIDIGPSLYTDHVLDLTVGAAKLRDPSATANNFARPVSYRILGMAKYAQQQEGALA